MEHRTEAPAALNFLWPIGSSPLRIAAQLPEHPPRLGPLRGQMCKSVGKSHATIRSGDFLQIGGGNDTSELRIAGHKPEFLKRINACLHTANHRWQLLPKVGHCKADRVLSGSIPGSDCARRQTRCSPDLPAGIARISPTLPSVHLPTPAFVDGWCRRVPLVVTQMQFALDTAKVGERQRRA